MGRGKVPADWPPISMGEAAAVLKQYPEVGVAVAIRWRSRRPMSAAGLVDTEGHVTVFVKRHHHTVRDATSLREEHGFVGHLRAQGVAVPRVLCNGDGDSVHSAGRWVYEVHECAVGIDAYREVPSWEPYQSCSHAATAGAALARFHFAAATYGAPARVPGVLSSSDWLVRALDPSAALDELVARRRGLALSLDPWPWRDQIAELTAMLAAGAPRVSGLASQWGHGDWHPSNLRWSARGPAAQVVGVMDIGLANRTSRVHDLAVALERSVVGWQDFEERGVAPVDLRAVDALVSAYVTQHPLSDDEIAALVALLPVVHVDFALSELEYFATVVGSPHNAELAYRGYLLGHAAWFAHSPAAASLLEQVQISATSSATAKALPHDNVTPAPPWP